MRKRKNRVAWRAIGYSSLGLLGILVIAMLFPATGVVTEALENTWSAAQSKVAVRAVETVSMRLATKMDLELTPSSKGSFGIAQTELGVTTNDPEGFEIFMNTLDSEAALRGDADKIQTIEAEMTGSEFSGNVWGYNLGKGALTESSIYSRVPARMTSVLKTASATVDAEEVYNLGFGVHITPSLPAGEYANSIVVSVVANPATISSLTDLVYMQDMTSELCANTYPTETDLASMTDEEKEYVKLNPTTKNLYDLRDGKQYRVSKLADGKCWMTQNLAFVITEEMANATGEAGLLNSNTTDIGYDVDGKLIDGVKYWNKDSEYPPMATYLNSELNTNTSVSSTTSWNFGDETFGSYYTYAAATASSGVGLTSGDAPDSLCPKGWKQPGAGDSDNPEVGSYRYLFQLFNAINPDTGKITVAPLYFALGGDMRVNQYTYPTDIRNGGYYWTATANAQYGTSFYVPRSEGNLNHFGNASRMMAKTIRCVAR